MENKYPIGGYAPGNYHCKCCTCGNQFTGDKRAVQCEPCAVAEKGKFDALSPEHQRALIERNAAIAHIMFSYVGSGDQIVANQEAGMPLEEAIFQVGYTAGVDFERWRKDMRTLTPEEERALEKTFQESLKDERRAAPTGAVWVKATSRLPGYTTPVKWRDGNDHTHLTSDKIPLIDMAKPFLTNWEWLDEGGE